MLELRFFTIVCWFSNVLKESPAADQTGTSFDVITLANLVDDKVSTDA